MQTKETMVSPRQKILSNCGEKENGIVSEDVPKTCKALQALIADSLLENALHFFRDRIENAFASRDYSAAQGSDRTKRGKNDSIFARLEPHFAFEQATQQSIAVKGLGVTRNSVQQMLKNWKKQGLVIKTEKGRYKKVESTVPTDEGGECGH